MTDMTPKQRSQFAEKALEVMAGSDRLWTVEDIERELGCTERHAYRVLKGLFVEDKITRQTLASTGVARNMFTQRRLFVLPSHTPIELQSL